MRIGVDMVSISQVNHALSLSPGLMSRIFSPRERKYAERMAVSRASEFLSGRFAAKEAVLKAMRVRALDAVAFCDIETNIGDGGSPELLLSASALRASEMLNVSRWQVSISHEKGFALAFVVAY